MVDFSGGRPIGAPEDSDQSNDIGAIDINATLEQDLLFVEELY